MDTIAKWMCTNTARLAGFAAKKGVIGAGYDADVVVWNPEEMFTVHASELLHRHPVLPYDGLDLFGKVAATFVGGMRVFSA